MGDTLPVAVIGAGPVGLAAAAHLIERGIEPVVFEQGESAGAAVRQWAHVRLFSAWSELVDSAAARLLEPDGWRRPDGSRYPTGGDWVSDYLVPLANKIGDRVNYRTRVTGVSRRGRDRVVDSGRDDQPFVVHVELADGTQSLIHVRAVVDASGTWSNPNPLGGDGYAAIGEQAAAGNIGYQMPDLAQEAVRDRYAGRHTVVAGSGHSALTALVALADLAESAPGTHITWLLRRGEIGDTFGGGAADQLPARGALGKRAKEAVRSGNIKVITGFRTEAVERDASGRLALIADGGDRPQRVDNVDAILALTGFRPDLSILSEVRIDLDHRLSAPRALAPMIDPNIHSCGTVPPHGVTQLAQPEGDLFVVGMKSYGRAPTFLALTGYEQVRSVAAALAGDDEAARTVELTLPNSGVCGGSGIFAENSAANCCGATPELVQIEAPAREMV